LHLDTSLENVRTEGRLSENLVLAAMKREANITHDGTVLNEIASRECHGND
jgi:hypothetical protein